MAYYIKVDHSMFSGAAEAVETYVTDLKKKMRSADAEVKGMMRIWQGADAGQFNAQWDAVTNGDSTYSEMVKSLESYAQYLRYAAGKYKDAQARAVNRANNLPRW